ncbi:fasciclin domain-containing protein [Luteibacter sp.]|uniref:fasciclin domain-containing protein n=1 Tax=Luteibacter sp. TaxID=1886636 RepID=UPI0025B997EA|nr:fasciclin domain-containing protein [Luteibacter sp.]
MAAATCGSPASAQWISTAPQPPIENISSIIQERKNTQVFQEAVTKAGGWRIFEKLGDITVMVPDDDACRIAQVNGSFSGLHTETEARDFVFRHVVKGQVNLQSVDRPRTLGVIEGERVIANWVPVSSPVQSVREGQVAYATALSGAPLPLRVEKGSAYIGRARIQGATGFVVLGGSVFVVDGCVI